MQDNSVLRVLHIIASVRKESGGPVEGLTQSVIYRQSIGQYIEVLTLDPHNAEFLNEFPCIIHMYSCKQKR